MNNKKGLLTKLLFGVGSLLLICGIFCFFGTAMKYEMGLDAMTFGPLFAFMLGLEVKMNGVPGGETKVVGGTTALFAIEMVIIVLAVILLVGIFAKKLESKKIVTLSCVICVLALVAVILAFCSKKMIASTIEGAEEALEFIKLGSAGISYGILGIIGILANVAGIVVEKKAA